MLSKLFLVLYILCNIYQYIFFVYIILSWFPVDMNNILIRILKGICEPVYRGILRVLPPLRISMIDLSPLYVIFLVWIIQFILRYLIILTQ